MDNIKNFIENYLKWISLPKVSITDIFEILILAFIIYYVILWIKDTKAWSLLKGMIILLMLMLLASIFELNVILWIFQKTINVGIIAVIIVFQPELRKALEQLGRKNIMSIIPFEENKDKSEKFSDKTVNDLVKACCELGKNMTGALIVIEKENSLKEFERTGIILDAAISSQLLINIFEHNTPLHDGAIILRGDRIVAATCYLPLSDNMQLSKELGTRHRAGVGISEVTDSLTIIVSEETGRISIAKNGRLSRNLDADSLRKVLVDLQDKKTSDVKKIKLWKGRLKDGKKKTQ